MLKRFRVARFEFCDEQGLEAMTQITIRFVTNSLGADVAGELLNAACAIVVDIVKQLPLGGIRLCENLSARSVEGADDHGKRIALLSAQRILLLDFIFQGVD